MKRTNTEEKFAALCNLHSFAFQQKRMYTFRYFYSKDRADWQRIQDWKKIQNKIAGRMARVEKALEREAQ